MAPPNNTALTNAIQSLPKEIRAAIEQAMAANRRDDKLDRKKQAEEGRRKQGSDDARMKIRDKALSALSSAGAGAASAFSAYQTPQATSQERGVAAAQGAAGTVAGGLAAMAPGGFVIGPAVQEAVSSMLGAAFHKQTTVMQGVQQGMAPVEELMAKGVPFSDEQLEYLTRVQYEKQIRLNKAKDRTTDWREQVGEELGFFDPGQEVIKQLEKIGHRIYDAIDSFFRNPRVTIG